MVLALWACGGPEGSDTRGPAPLDLGEVLDAGEVRAGVLVDEAGVFGGISAEARPGDVKIYNDRAQFVIQGVRSGAWYLAEGGGVIDADVVRPDGQPGRDAIEEWGIMYGLGRISIPETIEVVTDGRDGEAAIVRVTGYEGPLGLIEGALEAPGFVVPLGLEMETEYRLEPDSWLLEVTSTARATTGPATLAIGDLVMGADEILDPWAPGFGLGDDPGVEPRTFTGYVSERDDVAYLVGAPAGEDLEVAGYALLTELASMILGFSPTVTIEPGDAYTWSRYWGVGPDLATLTGAALAVRGEATQPVSGVVEAPDGPVAGARVVVDLDGTPYTAAVTGADGAFSADVPVGEVSLLAVGRHAARFVDLPDGAAPVSPYAMPGLHDAQMLSLREGGLPVPLAEGRGVAAAGALSLGEPGWLVVRADDGLPFTARVALTVPDATDPLRVDSRPDGLAAAAWSKDGEVRFPVEPGTYDVVVHRGFRYEAHQQSVTVAAGDEVTVAASLPAAFSHDGWLLGDPHVHASPSPDGSVTMEERVVVAAANGLQVHFGTDHDHLADYRPIVEALGLSSVLRTVVSDEVSPPMRGHFNIYPVEPDPSVPNNGAWTWWTTIPESTTALHDGLRAAHGDGFVLQSNHPLDGGMGASASWVPGTVRNGNYWSDRIEAVEVLNGGGGQDEYLAFWADLVLRGQVVTPTGVSDSHGHFDGSFGFTGTWIEVGTDDPAATTDDALAVAMRAGRVQPALGLFLALSHDPGSDVAPGTTIEVEARSASWAHADRVRLYENGVEVGLVDGRTASFTLAPSADAIYWVVVEGDAQMLPVSDDRPWAFAGPWRVDADGGGWVAPLPPLVIEE